jgi:hypothetical protein
MKMIHATFGANGREYRLYTVRSMGPGRGFGILDRYRNIFIPSIRGRTREDCLDFLNKTDFFKGETNEQNF